MFSVRCWDEMSSVLRMLDSARSSSTNTAAVDGANVVARMREFYRAREATETFNQVDLNELVPKAIMMTQPKWKDLAQAESICVRVIKELDESVPPIFGNEAELREILTNLIINAVDAVSGEGCIVVRTRREGDFAVLEVNDDGRGMPAEVAQRGVEVIAEGVKFQKPVSPIASEDFKDPIGAGDSFTATFLNGYLNGESLESAVEKAIGFASEVCKTTGAIPEKGNLYQ